MLDKVPFGQSAFVPSPALKKKQDINRKGTDFHAHCDIVVAMRSYSTARTSSQLPENRRR